jgi:hypothetical protein
MIYLSVALFGVPGMIPSPSVEEWSGEDSLFRLGVDRFGAVGQDVRACG